MSSAKDYQSTVLKHLIEDHWPEQQHSDHIGMLATIVRTLIERIDSLEYEVDRLWEEVYR